MYWLRLSQIFFKAYPEYASLRFFIAGESYAGVYVPTLANAIRVSNAAGLSNINLHGIMVRFFETGVGRRRRKVEGKKANARRGTLRLHCSDILFCRSVTDALAPLWASARRKARKSPLTIYTASISTGAFLF